jgi:hypothetical protein
VTVTCASLLDCDVAVGITTADVLTGDAVGWVTTRAADERAAAGAGAGLGGDGVCAGLSATGFVTMSTAGAADLGPL